MWDWFLHRRRDDVFRQLAALRIADQIRKGPGPKILEGAFTFHPLKAFFAALSRHLDSREPCYHISPLISVNRKFEHMVLPGATDILPDTLLPVGVLSTPPAQIRKYLPPQKKLPATRAGQPLFPIVLIALKELSFPQDV